MWRNPSSEIHPHFYIYLPHFLYSYEANYLVLLNYSSLSNLRIESVMAKFPHSVSCLFCYFLPKFYWAAWWLPYKYWCDFFHSISFDINFFFIKTTVERENKLDLGQKIIVSHLSRIFWQFWHSFKFSFRRRFINS